jgi:HD superfamily phosphohydrolase YqeK
MKILLFLCFVALISCTFLEANNEEEKQFAEIVQLFWNNIKSYFGDNFLTNKIQEPSVEEYINQLKRSELMELSFSLEKYHREINKLPLILGGLHDYVFKVPKKQLKTFILKEANEHQEINSVEQLKKLVESYKHKDERIFHYNREFIIGEGIHDFLHTLKRDELEKIALSLEEYHKKQREQYSFGGLHDYIKDLQDDKLYAFIAKEVGEHDEINNVESLKKMLSN